MTDGMKGVGRSTHLNFFDFINHKQLNPSLTKHENHCCPAVYQRLHVEEGLGDELLVPSAVSGHDLVPAHIGADDGDSLIPIPLKLTCNQFGSTSCYSRSNTQSQSSINQLASSY